MRMIVLISHDQLQAGRRSHMTSPPLRNPSRPGMADDESTSTPVLSLTEEGSGSASEPISANKVTNVEMTDTKEDPHEYKEAAAAVAMQSYKTNGLSAAAIPTFACAVVTGAVTGDKAVRSLSLVTACIDSIFQTGIELVKRCKAAG